MSFGDTYRFRFLDAYIHSVGTPGSEPAARRWIERTRQVTLDFEAWTALAWMSGQIGRKQTLRVRVMRGFEDLLSVALLHDSAHIHHGHMISHVADRCQIVGNHEIGRAEIRLNVLEEVQHLSLNRNVES